MLLKQRLFQVRTLEQLYISREWRYLLHSLHGHSSSLEDNFQLSFFYAMAVNKSQGQSLNYVGLYLPQSVFSQGQL